MGFGVGFKEEGNIHDEKLLASRGLLRLLQPAFANYRMEDSLKDSFFAGVPINEFPQQSAIGSSFRRVGGGMDFPDHLFPDGFIFLEQFAHTGIGIEGLRLDELQEQIAEGGFSASDPPSYSEDRHTKQMG